MKSAAYFSEEGTITVYLRKGGTVKKVIKTTSPAEAMATIETFMQGGKK